MATYTKIEKETATYTKTDKTDKTGKGWFKQGWFTAWFSGETYRKVKKILSNYTKIDK